MRKIRLALALSLGLLVGVDMASAQSGKSYSSGRSSSGGRSGSSSSGKSYSPGGSKPSSGGSGTSGSGKSYSSGGGKSSTPSPSGSGKSYSSGGSKPPAGTPSKPPAGPATPSKGKSYSSGDPATKSAPAGKGYPTSPDTSSRKPGPRSSYDPQAGRAQAQEESRALYSKGSEPRPTYTTPRGETKRIDPRDAEVRQLREQLSYERWARREQRQRESFGPYYSRPVVVYNDPYSNLFWWWLLTQSLDRQALWAYHHRSHMDEGRYRDLLARNAELEAKVRDLEQQKVPRDPAFTFDDVDRDLMYDDGYVEAAYNPQRPADVSCGHILWTCVIIGAVLAVVAGLIWLVFFKRWGSTS